MISNKLKKDIILGFFIIVGFSILFLSIILIKKDISLWGWNRYMIKVKFDFVEGLKPASPVRFCGVDIGEIKKVEVVNNDIGGNPYVLVYAKIKTNVKIPRNSSFFINSLTLLGEKYLEIIPPDYIEDFIKPEEVIEGKSSITLYDVVYTFNKTLLELNQFIREGKLRTLAEDIIINVEEITTQLSQLLEEIKSGKGNLGRLLYDEELYWRIVNFLRKLEEKEGTIGKLLYDDELYRELESLIKDIKDNPWKLIHKPKKSKK